MAEGTDLGAARGRRRGPLLAIAVAGVLAVTGSAAGAAGASPGPNPAGRGLRVIGAVPALPAGTRRLGPLPAGRGVDVEVVLRARHQAELARLASAVSEPGSPLRGHYLTPAAVGALIDPLPVTVSAVTATLARAGLRVTGVSADRLAVHASGTAGSVERAFHTVLEAVRTTGGRRAYVNLGRPALPAGVAHSVQAVLGLDSLDSIVPLSLQRAPATDSSPRSGRPEGAGRTRPAAGPTACSAAAHAAVDGSHTAPQLAEAYGMSELYAKGDLGQHVGVAVVEFEGDTASDISSYESCYGVHPAISYVKVDGGITPGTEQSGEAALDIETIAGLAPDVKEYVYQAPQSGIYDMLTAIVANTSVNVVSMSWGECESDTGADFASAEATELEASAAEGQTWLVSSGDSGSTACLSETGTPEPHLAVNDPAAQPFVTGVGGTSLPSITPFAAQTVWNNAPVDGLKAAAGGGGISKFWSMPQYQAAAPKGLGVINSESSNKPCGLSAGDCREVPDVSADADPLTGYVIDFHGSWLNGVGGTSAAAPSWASLVALTDAYTGCGGHKIGFADPSLYAIAGSAADSKSFVDVVKGNNDITSTGYTGGLFKAFKGYDMASGLGAPYGLSASGQGLTHQLCAGLKSPSFGMDFVSPSTGPAAGGTDVDVVGYGFKAGSVTGVDFGSRAGTDVKVENSGLIEVVSPKGSGTVAVTVHTAAGVTKAVAGDLFSYG